MFDFQVWNDFARLSGDENGDGNAQREASVSRLKVLLKKIQVHAKMDEYNGECPDSWGDNGY